jgi:hypothetical protein
MNNDDNLLDIQKKLRNLQLQNRLLLALLVAGFLGCLLYQSPKISGVPALKERVVVAQEFRLVDLNDKSRASLSLTEHGSKIVLFDNHANPRISLESNDHNTGPSIVTLGEDAKSGSI